MAGIIIAVALSSCCPPRRLQSSDPRRADSAYPNVDRLNTRHVASSIDSDSVSSLAVDWTLPITAQRSFYGAYYASPTIVDGVVYSQDQSSDVQAVDLETGAVLWEKAWREPIVGPNGVVVAGGLVYGATQARAFALDAKSGEEVWSNQLLRTDSMQIAMAPGYHQGTMYVSTAPAAPFDGGEAGVLWALDAKTGEKKWHFDTVPHGLWGNRAINYGGGVNYTPAFDDQGSMYFSVGIAGPIPGTERYPWGSSRPGPNLYTSSVVKLDAETGDLQWFHQVTPHGLCNWNLGPPVLFRGGGRDLVIVTGRGGVVLALDRQTGEPVWRQAVGTHNGHDNDGLLAMRGEASKLKMPMTVLPGRFGGVAAPISVSGSTVLVPVVNWATMIDSQTTGEDVGTPDGELVALDAVSGSPRWKQRFSSPLYGAITSTNDLVLASTFDGVLHALDAGSGEEVWEEPLPAGSNAGLALSGDTLLAPAGYAEDGQVATLVAYRLRD